MELATAALPNELAVTPDNAVDLAPIAANQRIEALDVVRGFALLGIFLMNIEFFNRTTLLFGMGFAVMMTRAQQAGREFKIVYLRRVLALAVFGAAHYILLWQGDILFSYAVAALMLMVAS